MPSAKQPWTVDGEELLREFLRPGPGLTAAHRAVCALRRWFVARSVKAVVYRESEELSEICCAAVCMDYGVVPKEVGPDDAAKIRHDLEMRHPRSAWPERTMDAGRRTWSVLRSSEEHLTVFFGLVCDSDDTTLVLRAQLDDAQEARMAVEYDQSGSDLLLFASAVRNLVALEYAEARLISLSDQLESAATGPATGRTLHSMMELLERFCDHTRLVGTRGVALEHLYHRIDQLLGLVLNDALREHGPYSGMAISEAGQRICSLAGPALSLDCRSELCLVGACLKSVERPETSTESLLLPFHQREASIDQRALALLAVAVGNYEIALKAINEGKKVESHLLTLMGEVRIHLPPILVDWTRDVQLETLGRGNFSSGQDPDQATWHVGKAGSLLQLWLVCDLASRYRPGRRSLDGDARKLYCALALVLREVLRTNLYRATPGLEFDQARFTQTLQVLVAQHACVRSAIPESFGLAEHLDRMAKAGEGRWTGDGHQEHVLAAYILGCFILDLRIGQQESRPLVDRLFHGRPEAAGDSRMAFSLASLFHDAGMLLFSFLAQRDPSDSDGLEELADQALREGVERDLSQVSGSLVARCIAELKVELGAELESEAWNTWMERQRSARQPDHELLSAWYLLRACLGCSAIKPAVRRSAVRATLLHGALGVPIALPDDLPAALLVFCDELCDWYPARNQSLKHVRRSRYLNSRRPLGSPRRGRAAKILVRDAWFAPDFSQSAAVGGSDDALSGDRRARGVIVGVPEASAEEQEKWPALAGKNAWPRIELHLRSPLELDAAVLEIWLRSAQNLGRICPDETVWVPVIKVTSRVPDRLQDVGHTTRELLDEVASKLGPSEVNLLDWLSDDALFKPPATERATGTTEDGMEHMYLVPTRGPKLHDNIDACMPRIIEEAEKIIGRWETYCARSGPRPPP